MKKKLFKELLTSIDQARKINKKVLICPNCERILPNKSHITTPGLCLWCDAEHWWKEIRRKK